MSVSFLPSSPWRFCIPTDGKKDMKSTKEAGEVEGSRWWWWHVCTLHLITHQQTPPVSAIQAGPSHHWAMWSMIFSALVLCCLCHWPLCDHAATPLPPRFSTLVAASLSAEQHGTVYISAKLALPFGPTLLHFRLLADAVIRGRQTGKWTQREETLQTGQRWQDAWWPLDSNP